MLVSLSHTRMSFGGVFCSVSVLEIHLPWHIQYTLQLDSSVSSAASHFYVALSLAKTIYWTHTHKFSIYPWKQLLCTFLAVIPSRIHDS